MLINPYTKEGREALAPIPGTRIIANTLGVVGAVVIEPQNAARIWTVQSLYTPMSGRALGGLRAKLMDQKGFVSFCNQRDLEVLLDVASPGGYCQWLDQEYVEPLGPEWFGLCVDEDDLFDDLYDRELEARSLYADGQMLPNGLNFTRRVHAGARNDYEELMVLLWDMDATTGGPDPRLETVAQRWTSVEKTPGLERAKLWLRL